MSNIKACVVCLSLEGTLFHMDDCSLRSDYNFLAGLDSFQGNRLPGYLCVECAAYVKKYKTFKIKCQRTNSVLQEILNRSNEIKLSDISAINREALKIMPYLSFLMLDKCRYEEMKFDCVKYNKLSIVKPVTAPIFSVSTLDNLDLQTRQASTESTDNIIEKKNYIKVEVFVENMKSDVNEEDTNQFKYDNNEIKAVPTVKSDIGTILPIEYEFDDDVNDLSDSESGVKSTAVDGSTLDEEYANVCILNKSEQKAVIDIYKLFARGKHKCNVCEKTFQNENRLNIHMRMHEKHGNGVFFCELCNIYYVSAVLLKIHITGKHMYKYECTKCLEVSFDRATAKQHYILAHFKKGVKSNANWYDTRPSWLGTQGGKRIKGIVPKTIKKLKKLPSDFPSYTPVSHLEQYEVVKSRQKSKIYIESDHKCKLCFRGFREFGAFSNHLKKHNPVDSGPLQCDVCKLHFSDTNKMYKHMSISHLFKYSCQKCDYITYDRTRAQGHYKWHKNVTYSCPHCDRKFLKYSSRLSHIRVKHPSMNICNICGHSFVSETGLCFHMGRIHSKEDIEISKKLLKDINLDSALSCGDCNMQFVSKEAYDMHLSSSSNHAAVNRSDNIHRKHVRRQRATEGKRRGRKSHVTSEVLNIGVTTASNCEECGELLSSDVQAKKHYKEAHPGVEFLKRYMCDVCGYTVQQYNNLVVHMRNHTKEKPYACHYCDKRFSRTFSRDRHLVVHTGEKRYECEHCNKRFTQSNVLKLHIQTVHLKIPYPPWDKKNKKQSKQMEANVPQTEPKQLVESQRGYLNSYISYHDKALHVAGRPEKPYACDICARKFSFSSNRDRHILVHSGEKRFECEHCNKKITQSCVVKLHIQTVYLKISYPPWDKKNLKQHKKRESNMSQTEPKQVKESQGEYANAFISYLGKDI